MHQEASPPSTHQGLEMQQTKKQHLAKEVKEGSLQMTKAEARPAECEAQKLLGRTACP